jgi:peptidoglycan/LPS O-acetylase OafA/YrhL
MPLVLTGILAVMWLSQQNSLLKPILNSKPMQFLGTISFSLYLTHEPIILALVTMRGGAGWHLILSIPISIAVGWLFYVAIESKAHKASKRFLSKRTKRL